MTARDRIVATIRGGPYVDAWIMHVGGGVQVDAERLADAIVDGLIEAGFDLSDQPAFPPPTRDDLVWATDSPTLWWMEPDAMDRFVADVLKQSRQAKI